MRHILIATHGAMATGMQKSIEMICGEKENVTYMNFYTEDMDYDRCIRDYMDARGDDNEILICTDVFYGSVSQKFLPYLTHTNTHMIAGVNLPVILEVLFCDEPLTKDVINGFIRVGHEQLYYVDIESLAVDSTEDFI